MERAENPSLRTIRGVWLLGGACALTVTVFSFAFQAGTGRTLLRPQPGGKGREVDLPRGDVLLFQFLQQFANYTGETVCLSGDHAPDTTISLPRSVDSLDPKAAAELLAENGYGLSQERYRGKDVYWVQRMLVPPRKKGRILRGSGETEAGAEDTEWPVERTGERLASRGGGAVQLYERREGNGARFVVFFETDSRREAETAVSLLRAQLESRSGPTGNPAGSDK